MLPTTHQEFSSRDYWDKFFIERKSKGFEWYGDWKDVKYYLTSHLNFNKTKTNVVNSNKLSASSAESSSKDSSDTSNLSFESLVIGCGNSTLSQDLYDDSTLISMLATNNLSVTSIDFSPVVISEMEKGLEKFSKKNKNNNGNLKYLLMDMLQMEESWKNKFDVVVDKGAIDALMTDDSQEVIEQATKMINEVRRVLKPNGIYFCVSLLQKHILSHLIKSFIKGNDKWKVDIHPFIPAAGSSLCPFVIIAKCESESQSTIRVHPFTFDQKATEKSLQSSAMPYMTDENEIERSISESRQSFLIQYSLKDYGKGFRGNFDIWDKNELHNTTPRFKISVLDSGLNYAKQVKVPMAVFIVPKGREKEWVFSSDQSRMEIATNNSIGRLVVVELGQSKTKLNQKIDMKAIQDELSKSILQLAPKSLPQGFNIPFMTVEGSGDDDVKERNVIQQGTSQMSGDYIVEDVLLNSTSKWHRRLIFQSNPVAVQSECILIDDAPKSIGNQSASNESLKASKSTANKSQTKKQATEPQPNKKTNTAKSSSNASASPQKNIQGESKSNVKSNSESSSLSSSADDKNKQNEQNNSSESVVRKKVNVILDSDDEDNNSDNENENINEKSAAKASDVKIEKDKLDGSDSNITIKKVDVNKLVFEFHRIMIAGLCLSTFKRQANVVDSPKRYMVVGLGGGALAMHLLKRKKPNQSQSVEDSIVDAIELDPEVIEIAHQYFGLEKQNPRMNIHAMNGLDFLKDAKEKYDAILFDVDAKDPSSPVVTPPLEFLEKSLLERIRDDILKNDCGIVVFNLACRSSDTQKVMLNSIKAVFSTVYMVHLGDSGLLNAIIFCLNTQATLFQKNDRKIKNEAIKICKDSLIDMEDKINLDDFFGSSKGKKGGKSQASGKKEKKKDPMGDIPIISAETEKLIALFDSLQLL